MANGYAWMMPPGYRSRRGKINKHGYMGRVLYHKVVGNRNFYYHATKGWRSRAL